MLVQIFNFRAKKQGFSQPYRVRGGKSCAPKADLSLFATAEQTYANGTVSKAISIRQLNKAGNNVVLGIVEPRQRAKSYGQFGQVMVSKCVWNYTEQLGKAPKANKFRTDAADVEIDMLNANLVFTKLLQAYGYTTTHIVSKIHAARLEREIVTLNINSCISFTCARGQKHTLRINQLHIKDAWLDGENPKFNFLKADIDQFKALIQPLFTN